MQPLDETPNLLAKEELNLLARLMGSMKDETVPMETDFRINLFPPDQEEEELVSVALPPLLPPPLNSSVLILILVPQRSFRRS